MKRTVEIIDPLESSKPTTEDLPASKPTEKVSSLDEDLEDEEEDEEEDDDSSEDAAEDTEERKDPIPDGTKVLIRKRYHENCTEDDYFLVFSEKMINIYGGKIMTIGSSYYRGHSEYCNVKDDGYIYTLVEDGGAFNWSSGMFQETGLSEKDCYRMQRYNNAGIFELYQQLYATWQLKYLQTIPRNTTKLPYALFYRLQNDCFDSTEVKNLQNAVFRFPTHDAAREFYTENSSSFQQIKFLL